MTSRSLVSLLCLVVAGPAAAQGDARDEDIFGPTEVDASAVEDPIDSSDIGERLAAVDDTLAIGGQLYIRLDWAVPTEGSVAAAPWRTPALLDVYLDGRPNDRVRAYFRGRLIHDFTVREGSIDAFGLPRTRTRVVLDQLWLKFDVDRSLFVTIGQQPLRWGAGRFWNPTDFLNQQFKDPLAVFDERLGTTLVKLHLPIEAWGWNLYAVANLGGAERPEEVGAALRAEILFGVTEVSATAAFRKDDPIRLGLDFSTGAWLFDLKGELAVLKGVTDPYFEGAFDLASDPDGFLDLGASVFEVTVVDRSDEWIVRGVLGAEIGFNYNEQDAVYVGVEYFYNGLGYEDASLYPWLVANGAFVPFYTGRHYAGLYVFLPAPGRWEDTSFVLSTLGNLSDNSYVSRLDASVKVLTHLRFNAYASWHWGDRGEFLFGTQVPRLNDAQLDLFGLEGAAREIFATGLNVVPPRLDLGVGLTVSL